MIPQCIYMNCGRRNNKQRDSFDAMAYAIEWLLRNEEEIFEREEKMTADITEKKLYAEVRNRYDSWAIFPKTDAEIIIEQEKELKSIREQIGRLKELADKANEEIKKLNEENKALIEENAKLKKESKTLTFESDGGLFNIEYQGMKFKATKVIIREGMLCNRVMEITANSVSE